MQPQQMGYVPAE